MGIRIDQQGNSWNLEQNGTLGRVGSTMINSGLSLLINNQQFYTYQPMMTQDGSEFILQGRKASDLSGIQVFRRIKLLEEKGAIRYLEVIANSSSNPANLTIALKSSFSGNFKSYLTDMGNSGSVMLGERESAVLVTPGTTQSNKAFLFTLTSPKSDLKPTITSQNRYGLTFQYNVSIPSGQTIVLGHVVAQVSTPQTFERKALARVFQPLGIESVLPTIPKSLQNNLVNYHFDSGAEVSGAELLKRSDVESLGVKRGSRDVLAIGGETRLVGTASCPDLTLRSSIGEAVIPFEDVIAIVGKNSGRRENARIYLKDGQVLSSGGDDIDIHFAMASGGEMNLNLQNLDRLVRAVGDSPTWGEGISAMIETYRGERLAVKETDAVNIKASTSWGELEFSVKELSWLASLDESLGKYIELKNGTRCVVFLTGAPVLLTSTPFGEHQVPLSDIRAIVSRAHSGDIADAVSERSSEAGILAPELTIVGNQKLVGPILSSEISILTGTQTVTVEPKDIRKLTNVGLNEGADSPTFQIELWGGGQMVGNFGDDYLEVGVLGGEWRIPVTDLVKLITPVPPIEEAAAKNVTTSIRDLGSDNWQTREDATEKLRRLGRLAKSLLEMELQSNGDAEVRRRIERLLEEIE